MVLLYCSMDPLFYCSAPEGDRLVAPPLLILHAERRAGRFSAREARPYFSVFSSVII